MIWGKRQKNKWMRLQTTGKSYGNKVQDAAEGLNGQDSGPVWRASDQRSGTFPGKLILRWESKMSWFFCLECLPPQPCLETFCSCLDSYFYFTSPGRSLSLLGWSSVVTNAHYHTAHIYRTICACNCRISLWCHHVGRCTARVMFKFLCSQLLFLSGLSLTSAAHMC